MIADLAHVKTGGCCLEEFLLEYNRPECAVRSQRSDKAETSLATAPIAGMYAAPAGRVVLLVTPALGWTELWQ